MFKGKFEHPLYGNNLIDIVINTKKGMWTRLNKTSTIEIFIRDDNIFEMRDSYTTLIGKRLNNQIFGDVFEMKKPGGSFKVFTKAWVTHIIYFFS